MKYNFDQIINRQKTNAMSVEGYGPYLFNGVSELDIKHKSEDLIRMWVADMEFAVAPQIIDAVKQRLEHPIFGYTGIFESEYLESFLNWTKRRYGWEFNKEHYVNSLGVIPALFNLIDYICKPGDKILIMTPSYAFFKHAADHNGIDIITSKLISTDGHYEMNFEDIADKAAMDEVKLCILCSPHNPTGRNWNTEELKQLGQICLDNQVMIIADEIHCDLLRGTESFTPLAKIFPDTDQIITCMATSKTFNLAGFMFANIIIPHDELRALWQQRNLPIVNPLSIVAAQACYQEGQDWLDELTIYLDANFQFLKDFLTEHLPEAKYKISEATYLAWVNLGAYFSKEDNPMLFFANEAGVILEGGDMFLEHADGYVRLNLSCPRSKLEEGLNRMAEAIKKKMK